MYCVVLKIDLFQMRIFKECHVNEKDERTYRQDKEGKGLTSVKQENTSRLIPSFILMLRFGEYCIVSGIMFFASMSRY